MKKLTKFDLDLITDGIQFMGGKNFSVSTQESTSVIAYEDKRTAMIAMQSLYVLGFKAVNHEATNEIVFN